MDGSVEALVHGPQQQIDQLIQKCWEGPSAAEVDNIVVSDSEEAVKAGFHQERTI